MSKFDLNLRFRTALDFPPPALDYTPTAQDSVENWDFELFPETMYRFENFDGVYSWPRRSEGPMVNSLIDLTKIGR